MNPLPAFLGLLGPLAVAVLVLAKGRGWLTGLAQAENSARRATIAGILLVSLGALAILPCLGTTSLYDRDEGYYAECAREMARGGDPVVPHFSGRPWMEKPPLTYWAMAAAMKLFGPTEFAARLPSALAALLAIWLTFRLATRMYSPLAGALAAAMLGTCVLCGAVARLALLDTTLLCCVLLSMIGLWQFIEHERPAPFTRPPSGKLPRPPRGGLVLFYVGCGLGGLAKGPLGVALPLLALAGYLAWSRDWRLLPKMRPLQGALLILAIVALWVVPANWLTGGRYIYELVWESTLQPIFTPLQGHGGGDLAQYLLLLPAYLPVLVLGFLPWSLFLLPALSTAFRKSEGPSEMPDGAGGLEGLPAGSVEGRAGPSQGSQRKDATDAPSPAPTLLRPPEQRSCEERDPEAQWRTLLKATLLFFARRLVRRLVRRSFSEGGSFIEGGSSHATKSGSVVKMAAGASGRSAEFATAPREEKQRILPAPLGQRPWKRQRGETPLRAAFLGGWVLAQLLAFSLVRTKLPHHILPLLPALAILCGAFLAELISGNDRLSGAWDALSPACRQAGSEICLFLLLAAGVAILLLPLAEGFVEEGLRFLPAGLLMIAMALWVRTALARKRYDSAFIALSAGMILSFGLLWQVGLPGFEKGKSAPRVARILRTHYGEANLATVRFGRLGYREVSIVFYLARPVEEIGGSGALKPFLMAPGPAAAILPEKDLRKAIAAGFDIPYRTLWKEKIWIPEKSEWQTLLIVTRR